MSGQIAALHRPAWGVELVGTRREEDEGGWKGGTDRPGWRKPKLRSTAAPQLLCDGDTSEPQSVKHVEGDVKTADR